jgi:transcription factor TGA
MILIIGVIYFTDAYACMQGESLRQQTLHRLHQILTTRQMARSLLAVSDYFHRLRTLSSLWVTRPRVSQEQQQQGNT